MELVEVLFGGRQQKIVCGTFDTLLLCEAADCRGASRVGGVCLTLSWYTIKADVSATHKHRFDSDCLPSSFYSSSPSSLGCRCLLCLHYQRKKRRKIFRDNFPWCRGERNSNKRKEDETRVVLCAWCFPQIFTYPSSAFVNSRFVVLSMICVHGSRLDDCLSYITMLLAEDNNHAFQLNSF